MYMLNFSEKYCRAVASGGAGGALAPQFLAKQLTLSQPVGADYAHHMAGPSQAGGLWGL